MLGGDGQEGAVHVLKGGEEGCEGVELSGGDVAEVHWVEHHQHVLAAELSQVDLDGRCHVDNLEPGDKQFDIEVHLLLATFQDRVKGEIGSLVSREKSHGGMRLLSTPAGV